MKRFAKYTAASIFFLIVLIYITTAMGISTVRHHETGCTGLNVIIKDSLKNSFVTRGDIKAYIDKEAGSYKGKPAGEIDLVKIEKLIDGKSAVYKSEAYMTRDGKLNVEVTQRTPVVRFNKGNGGFYADIDGFLFPLQAHNPSGILVIDGSIPLKADSGYKGEAGTPEEKQWLSGVLDMVSYISGSRLSGSISRLNVLPNGDLVIYPAEGKEKFIFGKPDNIGSKFKKIKYYYTTIVPEKGNGTYSTVNVKYDGQVICRK